MVLFFLKKTFLKALFLLLSGLSHSYFHFQKAPPYAPALKDQPPCRKKRRKGEGWNLLSLILFLAPPLLPSQRVAAAFFFETMRGKARRREKLFASSSSSSAIERKEKGNRKIDSGKHKEGGGEDRGNFPTPPPSSFLPSPASSPRSRQNFPL